MARSTRKGKAPELLRAFLEKHEIGPSAAGRDLRVSHVTVIAWRAGLKLPTPTHKRDIEAWSEGAIPADSWPLSKEEEESLGVRSFRRTGTEGR